MQSFFVEYQRNAQITQIRTFLAIRYIYVVVEAVEEF